MAVRKVGFGIRQYYEIVEYRNNKCYFKLYVGRSGQLAHKADRIYQQHGLKNAKLFLKQKKENSGYVYVVKLLSNPAIYKICKTRNFSQRLKYFKSFPYDVVPIVQFLSENVDLTEKLLHKYYEPYKLKSEWYKLPRNQVHNIILASRFYNIESFYNQLIEHCRVPKISKSHGETLFS